MEHLNFSTRNLYILGENTSKYCSRIIVGDVHAIGFDKLDQLLSSENIYPNLFWKTSKQLLNLNISSGSIPSLKLSSKIA